MDVKAIVEDTVSTHSNDDPAYIVISVGDSSGAGVIGLDKANFKLTIEKGDPGSGAGYINSVTSINPGIYRLKVLPLSGQTWKSGVNIFSISVVNGNYRGQTLCSFRVD